MNDVLSRVLADLRAEGDALDEVVSVLAARDWRRRTPAPGWDVATQIAHLAWTDEVAVVAATDPAGWDWVVGEAIADPEGYVDKSALEIARDPALLTRWRTARESLLTALADPALGKLPWFGPPMSATSMASARLMETWAHGRDVRDALGVPARPSDRIAHIVHLVVRTRDHSFSTHGLPAPQEEFRVEVVGPSGATWTFGPAGAAQSVTGPALDLCLLATQRINRADTALVAQGPDADRWLDIAQCFAGPPGAGREARR